MRNVALLIRTVGPAREDGSRGAAPLHGDGAGGRGGGGGPPGAPRQLRVPMGASHGHSGKGREPGLINCPHFTQLYRAIICATIFFITIFHTGSVVMSQCREPLQRPYSRFHFSLKIFTKNPLFTMNSLYLIFYGISPLI